MTEDEKSAVTDDMWRALKEAESTLACLDRRKEIYLSNMDKVRTLLESKKINTGFDIDTGRIRHSFKPIYPQEEKIVELLEEREKCIKEVARLKRQLRACGYGNWLKD